MNLSDVDEGNGNVIAFLEEMAMVKLTTIHWYKVSEIISRRPFSNLTNYSMKGWLLDFANFVGPKWFLATFYFVPSNQISL